MNAAVHVQEHQEHRRLERLRDRDPDLPDQDGTGRLCCVTPSITARGATYLMFLRRLDGELTPYWSPLAPTNEQVMPLGEEWVEWVRPNIR
jgi:hypothetical protein